jgi:hypothetical protein
MALYNFPNLRKGDTYPGAVFTINVNGSPLDLTSAEVDIDLRLTALGAVAKTFTSVGGGGITISATPTDGTFTIDDQIVDIAAGTYLYDIEITLSNGVVMTPVWGNWQIIQDITYD